MGIFWLISIGMTRIELFKRHKGQWILRTVMTQPPSPRIDQWLKSPFAQQILNKSVESNSLSLPTP